MRPPEDHTEPEKGTKKVRDRSMALFLAQHPLEVRWDSLDAVNTRPFTGKVDKGHARALSHCLAISPPHVTHLAKLRTTV